jgi:catechol 2,3-dioxygenase
MTRVQSLIAPIERPPYDILRSAHAELLVTDLDRSLDFYERLLGLIVTERTADAAYLRGWEEFHHHSLVLRRADRAAVGHVAFRVYEEADLDRLHETFTARGLPTRWHDDEPGQGRALRAQDPLGFPLEFFHEMAIVERNTQRFDVQRGAPVMRFDHLNFHVNEPEKAFAFWQELGFRCTEYISTDDPADERIAGAWLRRKPTVHDVALTTGRGPRLHHVGLWVSDPLGVLRACDQLAAAGHVAAIERGPGRHGVSNAFFVYLRDPDGHRIELYTCDYYTGDPDLPPLRWSVSDPTCRSFWGTRAPDSWYEESSIVLDLDGQPVETSSADVDERSEIMA